jgi:hypothetical protein
VQDLMSQPHLSGSVLGIDKTGVGAGVVEVIRAKRPQAVVIPVWITSGHKMNKSDDGTLLVPKLDLVASVTALLESGRLAIPDTLPQARTLGKELLSFKAKVTPAGNEVAEADWRSRAHDDLVLALAIGLYLGESGYGNSPTQPGDFRPPRRTTLHFYQERVFGKSPFPPGLPWASDRDRGDFADEVDEAGRPILQPGELYGDSGH